MENGLVICVTCNRECALGAGPILRHLKERHPYNYRKSVLLLLPHEEEHPNFHSIDIKFHIKDCNFVLKLWECKTKKDYSQLLTEIDLERTSRSSCIYNVEKIFSHLKARIHSLQN